MSRGGAREGAGRPPGSKNSVNNKHIRELAKEYTEDALDTLVNIMLKSKSDGARIMAANSVLDRAWGKATQPIKNDDESGPFVVQFNKIEQDIL